MPSSRHSPEQQADFLRIASNMLRPDNRPARPARPPSRMPWKEQGPEVVPAKDKLIGRLTWKGTFGFIRSRDGEEFFCSEKDFLTSGQTADTGDVVEFAASENRSGGRNRRAVQISLSQEEASTVEPGLDGHIVRLNWDGGFGFIRPKVPGKDVYFKISDCTDDLRHGASVVYSLQDDLGRWSAIDVICLSISTPQTSTRAPQTSTRAPRFGPMDRVMSGLVVSFKTDKVVDEHGAEVLSGYGFVKPDGEEDTVFVHSDEAGILKRGVRVSFNVIDTLKGRKAVNVGNISHLRVPCRNPLCKAGPCHFTDNCPLLRAARKAAKAGSDDADTESTCSTTDTNQPSLEQKQTLGPERMLGPNDRRQMRQLRRQRC